MRNSALMFLSDVAQSLCEIKSCCYDGWFGSFQWAFGTSGSRGRGITRESPDCSLSVAVIGVKCLSSCKKIKTPEKL